MRNMVLNENNIYRGATINERDNSNVWEVFYQHHDYQNAWVITVEEKIEEFNRQFKKGVKYDASSFYDWHTHLTGSCKSGKDYWVAQNGVDLTSKMTVEQFINLTKDAYGGEVIRRLMS